MLRADGSTAGKASSCPLRVRRSRRCRRCRAVSLRCRDSIEVLTEICDIIDEILKGANQSRKSRSTWERDGCRSFDIVSDSIWRIRSQVTP
jgi:hypothetical protein